MSEDGMWKREAAFWTEGRDYYQETLADAAVMVFPDPAGRMERDAILDSLDGPRWEDVEMSDRLVRAGDGIAVLAYTAKATRADGGEDSPYRARCLSVYIQRSDGQRLLAHQQTPL